MAKKKTSQTPNQHLKVPEELARIDALRKKLAGTDRDDHLDLLDQWEQKVKQASIMLALRGHEGIEMILKRAEQELREIDEVLGNSKPTDFSPDGLAKYAFEQKALYDRRELWEWFRSLFTDAKRQIQEVQYDLDTEDELEKNSTEGV